MRTALLVTIALVLVAASQAAIPTTPTATWEPPAQSIQYGRDLAIDGDTAAISYLHEPTREGRVEIRQAPSWSVTATLTAPSGASDRWGQSIALQGDTLAVGDWRNEGGAATSPGTIHFFERTGPGVWAPTQTFSGEQSGDRIGRDLRFDGEQMAAGGDGTAYVLERVGGAWQTEVRLEGSPRADFGIQAILNGDHFLVSAPRGGAADDCSGPAPIPCLLHSDYAADPTCAMEVPSCDVFWTNGGKIASYLRTNGGWVLADEVRNRSENATLGASMAFTDETLVATHDFSYDDVGRGHSFFSVDSDGTLERTLDWHAEGTAVNVRATAAADGMFLLGARAGPLGFLMQHDLLRVASAPYWAPGELDLGSSIATDGATVLATGGSGVSAFPASRLIPTTP